MSTAVLVDTSALFSLVDPEDDDHASARGAFARLEEEELVTHSFVVGEALALVQSRLGLPAARLLIDGVFPRITVAWVDADLFARASSAMLAADRRSVSLVDWTSFTVMRDRGIDRAFAFDADFAAQGFTLLPGE